MDAQEQKLRQSIWIVIGVGIFLTVALAVGLVTQVVNKQRLVIDSQQKEYTTQKQLADQLPTALKDKQKAEDRKEYANGQLAFFRQRYRSLRFDALDTSQLSTEGLTDAQKANLTLLLTSNRQVVWRRWMNEYASGYGLALRREIIHVASITGVTLKTSIAVGDPPRAPEECVPPANGLFRPTGAPLQITITGSLSNILQFFNRVNESSILMMVNNDLKMSGYSPDLTATFSITPYLLASGDGAPITAGAAASGGAVGAVGGSSTPGSALGASPSASAAPGGSSNST